jgi:hypothetical protein
MPYGVNIYVGCNGKNKENMKKILLLNLILLSIGLNQIKSQIVKSDIIKKNDSSYMKRQFSTDSTLLFTVYLRSINPEIKHGKYTSYHTNRKVNCIGRYYNDVPIGKWLYYDTKDSLIYTSDYNNAFNLMNDTINTDPQFVIVDEDAKFNGGDISSFLQFIKSKIHYPDYDLRNNISGRIITQFSIDTEGIIRNVKILKGIDNDLGLEVYRVLSESPRWTPAKVGKKIVTQQFVIPIDFIISE